MRSLAKCYSQLRAQIETIPLIDCHDHSKEAGPKPTDPITAVIDWYMLSDLTSASSDADAALMMDEKRPLEERWPVFERAWRRTRFTGYALVVRRAIRHFYGENDLSLEALQRIREKMIDFSDPKNYEAVLDEARIVVRLEDVYANSEVVRGTLTLPPRSRLVISLPDYHAIRSFDEVQAKVEPLGRHVTSLDEYIAGCREIFSLCKQAGAVAFKDQSAYTRSIHYANPGRAEAEAAFNWMMEDPRRGLSYPDGNRPLGDYLFHEFMRMARDLDLPVQIHTGHMAGIRNEITKTNAAGLTSLIELHRDTRFDLFHANWPYSGELLFLGKNYPNVALDFCWTNMVDPLYAQALFQQAISSVPHAKIHGYGSDLGGATLTSAWAHADLARDNIAIALANLVEMEYLDQDEAYEIAYAWLFGNPNGFFRLGL
ncbi:MAG TPA: amidohydrolase family protein [Anaerolinea sp.]|nr:amidohydrolase family protein [Anaerolinea sp.]